MTEYRAWVRAISNILSPDQSLAHEAEWIAEHLLKKNFGSLSAEKFADLNQAERDRGFALARARAAGKPLQYLLGEQFFYGRKFWVNESVLIPRPETEGLVELCLNSLPSAAKLRGMEVGVGSGVISITLLNERPNWQLIATEFSAGAQAVAEKNSQALLGENKSRLGFHRVRDAADVLESWLEKNEAPFDFLISNPPYLLSADEAEAQVNDHEPAEALYAPVAAPLYFYEQIAKQGPKILKSGGSVFLEIPHERASQILALFQSAGFRARLEKDLNQRDRYLIGEKLNG